MNSKSLELGCIGNRIGEGAEDGCLRRGPARERKTIGAALRKAAAAAVAILAVATAGAGNATAQGQGQGRPIEVKVLNGSGFHAGEFQVPLNKSQILRLDVPFKDISIGNARIADVLALTNRTMYILGKGLGSTSLTIFGPNKQLIAVADLVVTFDIEGIKSRLHDLLPGEKLEVRSVGNSVVLSGFVSSAANAQTAMSVANSFAPKKVTNMLRVKAAQQVMLQVRFAEVQRSALKDVANSLAIQDSTGNPSLGSGSGISDVILGSGSKVVGSFISGTLGLALGDITIQALFSALETKGFSRTLAEPTLVALSGDTASFLAGGEYPITTSDGDDIKTEFKKFGISLEFTPTVLDRNRINLVVKPEVSQLDFNLANQVGKLDLGLQAAAIPPLSTRAATTTVELGDGQSFAIAGLISNEFDNSVSQVPWLANVPILGALMRSSDFVRQETELVMVVTPFIVKPLEPKDVTLPTDKFLPPSEKDFFLMGKIRHAVPNVAPAAGPGAKVKGGIAGAHGHIVE